MPDKGLFDSLYSVVTQGFIFQYMIPQYGASYPGFYAHEGVYGHPGVFMVRLNLWHLSKTQLQILVEIYCLLPAAAAVD